jgi:hypothetical protein
MERAEWRLIAGGEGMHWPKRMKISAWHVSWRVADPARRRSLFADGSGSGNRPAKEILAVESTQTVPLSAR